MTRVAIWRSLNKHYTEPYKGDEEHAAPEERDAIIGPTTESFPLNDGWYIGDNPRKPRDGAVKRLSELTIHEITQHFTKLITDGVRPNCEENWNARVTTPLSDKMWMEIWRSIGTPLSDPTEEKNWRHLLHRATDARNRHPNKSHMCRLQCGEHDESMLHMITCPNRELKAYWNNVNRIRVETLNDTQRWKFPETIIFGIDANGILVSETSRAWLRHAVRWWYAAMTEIDKNGGAFTAAYTLEKAVMGLREAAVRWATSIKTHYIARKYTKLTGVVKQEERERFNTLVTTSQTGQYTLTTTFSTAIAQIESAARTERQRAQQAREQRQQQRQAQRPRHR